MTTSQQPSLPADLQAKLNAAGVTDDATLHTALERDPDLRAEFDAWQMQSLPPQPAQTPAQDLTGLGDLSGQSRPSAGATFDNQQATFHSNSYQAQQINITNVFDLK